MITQNLLLRLVLHLRIIQEIIAGRKRATGIKVTKAVVDPIDYVQCQNNATETLKDSRSCGGTDINFDHKLVITRLRMDILHLMHKDHTKGAAQARTDIDKLRKDPSV